MKMKQVERLLRNVGIQTTNASKHPEESTQHLEYGENFEIKNKATFTHPIALAM
jgi:hypothetical protein